MVRQRPEPPARAEGGVTDDDVATGETVDGVGRGGGRRGRAGAPPVRAGDRPGAGAAPLHELVLRGGPGGAGAQGAVRRVREEEPEHQGRGRDGDLGRAGAQGHGGDGGRPRARTLHVYAAPRLRRAPDTSTATPPTAPTLTARASCATLEPLMKGEKEDIKARFTKGALDSFTDDKGDHFFLPYSTGPMGLTYKHKP